MAVADQDIDTMSGRIERLPLSELTTGRYQRDLNAKFVTRIAHEWDEHRAGVLAVSHRNGRYFLIDGQHRHAAAKSIGIADLPCQVWETLTEAGEAALFVRLQTDRRPVKRIEQHKARLVYRDPEAMSVERAVTEAGCQLGGSSSTTGGNTIASVASCYEVHRLADPLTLTQTLEILRRAWPLEKPTQRWGGHMVAGVGMFLAVYPTSDVNHLVENLNAITPRDVLHLRAEKTHAQGSLAYRAMVIALVEIYNRRRGGKKVSVTTLDAFQTKRASEGAKAWRNKDAS